MEKIISKIEDVKGRYFTLISFNEKSDAVIKDNESGNLQTVNTDLFERPLLAKPGNSLNMTKKRGLYLVW